MALKYKLINVNGKDTVRRRRRRFYLYCFLDTPGSS